MDIESEINIYRNKIEGMSDQDLLSEFKNLESMRKTGKEKDGELQINFNLIRIEERRRGINLHAMKVQDIKVEPEIEMIECDSTAIHSYAYNELLQILYIRLRSKETIYTYVGITPETYNEFINAESKGRYYVQKIKGKLHENKSNDKVRVGTKRKK